MKRILLLSLMLVAISLQAAQTVTSDSLKLAAVTFMKGMNHPGIISRYEPLVIGQSDTVGHLFYFTPAGFLIIAANRNIRPVYGYSVHDEFLLPANEKRIFLEMIVDDLSNRNIQSVVYPKRTCEDIQAEWQSFLSGSWNKNPFEQWPPEGTTATGGWLETNWTQTFPYNMMCPMDLNAGARSVAGCPATAMAQVINYHRSLNETRFTDGDDYYHSYGGGNQYWIDDDHQARGFPSFDSVNQWLDTLESVYAIQGVLADEMKAALTFACGVAAHQVYTASVSGTFGLEQALMAYERFGYTEAHLVFPDDTTLNNQIAENIKVGLPSQLGLLVSTGSGGHNVVVDGYNTNEYYHFNFGWGGSANGWYTLPPQSAPYNLTIIESVIVDIKSDIFTGSDGEAPARISCTVTPNPFAEYVIIKGSCAGNIFRLYNHSGKCMLERELTSNTATISTESLSNGLYFYTLEGNGKRIAHGILIRKK